MEKGIHLLHVIQKLSKTIREIKERAFSNTAYCDVSVAGLQYIDTIRHMQNPTCVELAHRLGLSKPSVSNMVNKLIDMGYVQKTRSLEDGRVLYISLTDRGNRIAQAHHDAHYKVVEHIDSRLDRKEINTLIALLQKIC